MLFTVGKRGFPSNCVTSALGDIVWPTYGMYYAKNAEEYWKALALRNMLVTDVWDYVPGSSLTITGVIAIPRPLPCPSR